MSTRFVDDYLLYLLARASSEISAQFHTDLKRHGLQVSEWRVLATLSDGDGMTLGEVAARGLTHQPTMTKTIDRMERAELVSRRKSAADRRQVRIYITTKGRKRIKDALAAAKTHEAEVLSDYSPVESLSLKTMLQGLIERNGAATGEN
jgi:3-hydroxy-9,10-secoandrosta-1,3,5(10)-triene-9,17-dione monooxygenase reductase component